MLQQLTTFNEVDFLPELYRQRGQHRGDYLWRSLVLLVLFGIFAVTGFFQFERRAQLQEKLQAVNVEHAAAVKRNAHLADVQRDLEGHRAQSGLLTYLRHPWPRTQLLAAVVEPLPESITLTEWQITHETPPGARPVTSSSETKGATPEKGTPHSRDLKRLLQEAAPHQQVVVLTGHAHDSAALHEYLARLGANSLFTKIDLRSIENLPVEKTQSHVHGAYKFTARAVVRPGYGQGTAKPEATAAMVPHLQLVRLEGRP